MSKSLERRVESLERGLGEGDAAHVYVVWSDEEAEAIELSPGDTLQVVTWLSDDSIESETVRVPESRSRNGD